jgi:glyoxylase-like metal-dependent hydrolase (beta-lactamase superfamily II)
MDLGDRWTELADGVFARRYAFYDQQIGLIVGDGEALVIDTRTTSAQARELIRDIARITAAPVRIVVDTHWHYDHTFGNHDFRPATIWGHERCRSRLLELGEERRAEMIAELPGFADDLASLVIDPPEQTFADARTIEVGGRRVEMRYLGRGHTDSDIVIRVPDAGVIFAGDLVENGAPPSFGDGYPIEWPATVERMLDLIDGPVVPGHGAIGDRAFVRSQIEDLRTVAAVGQRVAAGELERREALRLLPYPTGAATDALDRTLAQLRGELD